MGVKGRGGEMHGRGKEGVRNEERCKKVGVSDGMKRGCRGAGRELW